MFPLEHSLQFAGSISASARVTFGELHFDRLPKGTVKYTLELTGYAFKPAPALASWCFARLPQNPCDKNKYFFSQNFCDLRPRLAAKFPTAQTGMALGCVYRAPADCKSAHAFVGDTSVATV